MDTWLTETLKVRIAQARVSNKSEERVEVALLKSGARIRKLALRDSNFEGAITQLLAGSQRIPND
jgi:hypothetical protein